MLNEIFSTKLLGEIKGSQIKIERSETHGVAAYRYCARIKTISKEEGLLKIKYLWTALWSEAEQKWEKFIMPLERTLSLKHCKEKEINKDKTNWWISISHQNGEIITFNSPNVKILSKEEIDNLK